MSEKPSLWLLVAPLDHPDLAAAAPTVAWMAEAAGAAFECYFECARDGELFARTGSTVLGGHHHQQFNWLCARTRVRLIRLGNARLFESSARAFGLEVLAQADRAVALYQALLPHLPAPQRPALFFAPATVEIGGNPVEIGPYLFPEIFFRRALGLLPEDGAAAAAAWDDARAAFAYVPSAAADALAAAFPACESIDAVLPGDDIGSVSLRLANRWRNEARGVVFGDPPAVLAQVATHCRHRRVAVFAPAKWLTSREVTFSNYVEATSPIADATADLAVSLGNPVITGRQTCDGDIVRWSKHGVCIQIIDPNRPAFPIVETLPQPWTQPAQSGFDLEPSDDQLRAWAREGRRLTTIVWHSGETAHTEAMLNLVDLAVTSGVKMGIGVHAQRYETAPQMWELIQTPVDRGGALGLIEPVLHSGGLGVMAEYPAPAASLAAFCREALRRIEAVAGPAGVPKGYYAFLDTDFPTFSKTRPEIWEAIASAGLEYVVSSARPGLNRVLWRTPSCLALNQTCRVIMPASPFVRIGGPEDYRTAGGLNPGWTIVVQDAPVIAFNPYIWRDGASFMRIVDWLKGGGQINVTPRVIARYARIIADEGYLPPAEKPA